MQENGDFVDADSRYHGHHQDLYIYFTPLHHGEASQLTVPETATPKSS